MSPPRKPSLRSVLPSRGKKLLGRPGEFLEKVAPFQPRAVLDTNVVLSALIFANGKLVSLRHAWQSKVFHPLVSKLTTEDLLRALAYPKFGLSAADQHELLADYLPYCTTVAIPDKQPKIPACRDAFDIPFLQLAIAGKADFLVSGDRDILSLKGEFACPVMTAEEYLAELAET